MPTDSKAAAVPAAAADSGCASTITTTTVTGWHVLKIKGYSQSIGLVGVGNALDSAVFTVGGHRWRIEYFPDGYTEYGADFICFDLVLDSPAAEGAVVKAKYVFSLLDQAAGKPVPEYTAAVDVCEFSSEVPSWGLERFIERDELEASPYLKDDSFSVRCDVTVYKEIPAQITTLASRRTMKGVGFILLFIALFVACLFGRMC